METIKRAVRDITSQAAQRVVVNTVLLACGAISLFCLAAVATILFFSNFVPDQFVTTPIYLQYGSSSHPYGIAQLPVPLLKSQQDYDISVTLSLPRSPANTERGNFMISLYLLDSTNTDPLDVNARKFANRQADAEQKSIVFHSRRPTLFPYTDPVVSLASRLLFLLYHMLVSSAQSCKMIVPLAERVVFDRDSTIPASAYVEIEAGQGIQIYSTVLTMTAQLHGLRWLMFHYRAPTFVAFTSIFWVFELLFMSVAWGALSSSMGSSAAPGARDATGKRPRQREENGEDEEYSDEEDLLEAEQQVPRYERDSPKKEEEEELNLADIPMMVGTDADDEEEDNNNRGGQRGTGSGYRQGQGSGSLRRRGSRNMD